MSDLFCRFDSGWYGRICLSGYDTMQDAMQVLEQRSWAFFPLYPLCVRLVNIILPFCTVNFCGIVVSNICIVIASMYVCMYIDFTRKRINKNIILFLIFLGPYSFYFNSMYTEAMFVLFVIMHYYYCKKGKYVIAGISAGLASATRLTGVLLVFVLLYNIVMKTEGSNLGEKLKMAFVDIFSFSEKLLAILLCPIGLFGYMAYLYYYMGDAFAFMHAQIGWARNDRMAIQSLVSALLGKEGVNGIYLGICAIIIILLLVFYFWKGNRDESIYGLATIYIPLRASVGCIPRYAIGVLFPLMATAQVLTGNSIWKKILMITMFLGELVLIWLWFRGAWVLV